MYKVLLVAALSLLAFQGCSTQTSPTVAAVEQEPMYVDENTLILFALDAQAQNKFAETVGYFDLLYKRTKDPIYRDKAMEALMHGHYFNDVISRLEARRSAGETLNEQELRYLVLAYLAKKAYVKAEAEAQSLVNMHEDEKNLVVLAEVYRVQKDYLKMLAALERAYQLNYSEDVLDKIVVTLYANMQKPYEAIGRINAHNKNLGYSLLLSKRLALFYRDQGDIQGLLDIYPKLYEMEPTKEHADVIIQLYWSEQKIPELIAFLEKSHTNDELLLKIYSSQKKFEKAIPLAQKLYDESGDLDFLGQKAIFMYESSKNRSDTKLLDSVIKDLTEVVAVKEEGYYLNYLGYCMIEHDRNVSKGISYVKRALETEPDSGYFIDSLAWGYYKEGKCKEADALMQKVVELLGADDPEVKTHVDAINRCLKGSKK